MVHGIKNYELVIISKALATAALNNTVPLYLFKIQHFLPILLVHHVKEKELICFRFINKYKTAETPLMLSTVEISFTVFFFRNRIKRLHEYL